MKPTGYSFSPNLRRFWPAFPKEAKRGRSGSPSLPLTMRASRFLDRLTMLEWPSTCMPQATRSTALCCPFKTISTQPIYGSVSAWRVAPMERAVGLTGYRASSLFRPIAIRTLQTLNNFEGAIRFLREAEISEMERERAIIGAIGDLDAYQLPDAKGYSSMVRQLVGVTEEDRQRFREEVLSTTAADFRRFGEALAEASRNSVVGVVGPKERIEAANAEKSGLFEIVPVL